MAPVFAGRRSWEPWLHSPGLAWAMRCLVLLQFHFLQLRRALAWHLHFGPSPVRHGVSARWRRRSAAKRFRRYGIGGLRADFWAPSSLKSKQHKRISRKV